jgi:hypothetical protein
MNNYLLTVQEVLTHINNELEDVCSLEEHARLEYENIKTRYYSGQWVSLPDFLRLPKIEKEITFCRKKNEALKIDMERLKMCEERVKQLDGENPKIHVINEEQCLARISYTTRDGSGHLDTLLSDIIIRHCKIQSFLSILLAHEDWSITFLDL